MNVIGCLPPTFFHLPREQRCCEVNHHQDIGAGLSDLFARTDFASLQATAQPFRESWVLGQPERCFLLFCIFCSEPSEVSASGGGPTDGRPGKSAAYLTSICLPMKLPQVVASFLEIEL